MTDDRSPRPAPARCFVVTRVAADDAPVRVLAICSDGARAASALAAGLGGNAGARDDAWRVTPWPLDVLVAADDADDRVIAAAAGIQEADPTRPEIGPEPPTTADAPNDAAASAIPDDAELARVARRAAVAALERLLEVAGASPGGPLAAVGEAFRLREDFRRRMAGWSHARMPTRAGPEDVGVGPPSPGPTAGPPRVDDPSPARHADPAAPPADQVAPDDASSRGAPLRDSLPDDAGLREGDEGLTSLAHRDAREAVAELVAHAAAVGGSRAAQREAAELWPEVRQRAAGWDLSRERLAARTSELWWLLAASDPGERPFPAPRAAWAYTAAPGERWLWVVAWWVAPGGGALDPGERVRRGLAALVAERLGVAADGVTVEALATVAPESRALLAREAVRLDPPPEAPLGATGRLLTPVDLEHASEHDVTRRGSNAPPDKRAPTTSLEPSEPT